jgi:two-component system alkaline phosphatase synthesis response regulator PhoP
MPGNATKKSIGPNRPERNTLILLLGSEPVARAAIRDVLEDAGYVVLPAGNLGTAVTMLSESPVDLLIVHPYIAEMSGHEAARYLRTKDPGMRVLMVDGLVDDDRIRHWAGLEKFEIFPKPFAPAQLIEKVRAVLALPPTSKEV